MTLFVCSQRHHTLTCICFIPTQGFDSFVTQRNAEFAQLCIRKPTELNPKDKI